MTTHMPTLVSMRAFEAVARLKSFRKAADEICVTHAAVSHQIKASSRTHSGHYQSHAAYPVT